MTAKLHYITELAETTARDIAASPDNWTTFLKAAAWNYKYPFQDQLLLYAQRPDATACAPIGVWNKKLGRWVKRGVKGIALIDDSEPRLSLRYIFDISDTDSRSNRTVNLWTIEHAYEDAVTESLESTFGELSDNASLPAALISAAQNAVDDNMADYLSDLMLSRDGSFLEDLDARNVQAIFREILQSSVAYMALTRCGYNPDDYLTRDDFRHLFNFNTLETISHLGAAASDISEMLLRDIESTVKAQQRAERNKNRTFVNSRTISQNKGVNQNERIGEHGTDLHAHGRLPSSRPDATGGDGTHRQVWDVAQNISEEPQEGLILEPDTLQRPAQPSVGDRPDGESADRENNGAAPGGQSRTGQSNQPDELGSAHEQPQSPGGGNGAGGAGLQLEWFDRRTEDRSLPFFHSSKLFNEMLRSTPHLKATRQQIADFFTAHDDITERTEFIKSIFNNDYTELLLDGDQRVGYKTYQNVLHVWEGSYTQRMSQAYYNWSVVAGHYASMLLLGEFLDNGPPGLPTEQQQIVMIEQAEVEKASAFAIPQEAIDAILQQGSGVQDGKYRIYLQFQKDASAKENTDFLRNEYGIGGHGPALTGTDIDEWHDGKGITLTRGSLIGENRKITLPWAKVQKRISELITADRYLNSKEKERLPVYEKQMVDHLQQLAEQAYAREVLNREPAPDLPEMPERENEKQILSIGSIVYVGADQYEVVSLDENTVELRDKNFPLLNKSYPRHAFKQVLNENQLNSHLILPVQAAEEDEPEVLPRKLYQLSDEGQVTREELIVGLELTIEDRRFAIDSISKENGTVSLRDVTFQNGTGFPIFRRESIAFVRDAIRQQKRAAHLKTQADEAPKVYPAPKLENQQQVKVNFHITDENLGVGGQKTKYAWNVAAIRLLNQLEKENRLATPEEQQILSRYVGWGGIPQAFDENSASWAKEYVDLKELLDADEYASARASTLNAHYTSPTVIKAIYTCLENMGFRTGNILEIKTPYLIQFKVA